jgi:[histone H3]-dimethyl-L-lysine9 demethylase
VLDAKCGGVGLGPKVYFALAAKQDDGHHGSTRLHCDLTDAINVCVFASPQSDGSPGGARWDIFSPDDTARLRTVLRVHGDPEDPILAQNTYLGPSALRKLESQHGIKASTFIQREGDAVFIPAGCAHQVSCISILSRSSKT